MKTKSRIHAALNWMLLFSDKKFVYSKSKKRGFWFRLNFITLTLPNPQYVSDRMIVRYCLEPFLLWMQRKHNAWNYVWKAEIQPQRFAANHGRCIHFHITTNKFIHYMKIRNKWNSILKSHGMLSPGDDPNSTDVHSVMATGAIISYFSKYVAKSEADPRLRVSCKIWGCNHNLSRLNCTMKEDEHKNFWQDVDYFTSTFSREKKQLDHATIFFSQFNLYSQLPKSIALRLREQLAIFNSRDDGIKKYSVN